MNEMFDNIDDLEDSLRNVLLELRHFTNYESPDISVKERNRLSKIISECERELINVIRTIDSVDQNDDEVD